MLCGKQPGRDTSDALVHDPDDMPLSKVNSCKLTAKWNALIDGIHSDEKLQAELLSLGVFSDLQLKKLKASYIDCLLCLITAVV